MELAGIDPATSRLQQALYHLSYNPSVINYSKLMELAGIDPATSRMLSERSTI